MKKNNYIRFACIAFYFLCALCLLPSCVNESMGNCGITEPGINLQFRYTYNIKESDAFGHEVGNINVWVFDSDDVFVAEYVDKGGDQIINGFAMPIPALPAGQYTFVAWARSIDMDEENSNFQYAGMTRGESTLPELTARLMRNEDNYFGMRLNKSLNGTVSADIGTEQQTVIIDMLKCTNTMRIILMPYRPGQQLDVDDYDFLINGKSAWLNYDASLHKEDPVTYIPYYTETLREEQTKSLGVRSDNGAIDNAAVAELNMSRLFYDIAPRFVIKDRKNGKVLMDINLTWFLSLQAIGERKEGWSDQEYLDRQDSYAITFFIDGETLMMNHIVVNGWVVSLEDNELS